MFGVVFDVVCEEGSNVCAFCFLDVFGKCFLEVMESSPILWCVVCLRAFVESVSCGVVCVSPWRTREVCVYMRGFYVVCCFPWM